MMASKETDRDLQAMLKLIELTQTGIIEWEVSKPWGDLKENDDTQYSSVFVATYAAKKLRLFRRSRRIDRPSMYDIASAVAVNLFDREKKYPYWQTDVVLQVTDNSGASLWEFPNKSALHDLLAAVRKQASGVDELIDDLLGNSESEE
jgi:hypothetical protein